MAYHRILAFAEEAYHILEVVKAYHIQQHHSPCVAVVAAVGEMD